MQTVGILGLGRNGERSVGHSLGKLLLHTHVEYRVPERILVHSRSSSTVDLFFQHGLKEVLESHGDDPRWEKQYEYRRQRATRSVEDIVHETVRRASYEEIAEQAGLVVISLEASLPTAEMNPSLGMDVRRQVYPPNAIEIRKITPVFRDYSGMVWIVTNPPGWHCLDWYEQTRMSPDRIVGVHPETLRLRDYTGLYRYLQTQGLEIQDLHGIDALYVLGDHGGGNQVVALSPVTVQGRIPTGFDHRKMRKDVIPYVNQLANETLRARKSTSSEIAALVSRMVRSYFLEDGEEYVLAVYANHLGNGKAVWSGEPAVFRNGCAQTKPLDAYLSAEEKTAYTTCLERMWEAWKGRSISLDIPLPPSRLGRPLNRCGLSFARGEPPSVVRPPLFLPSTEKYLNMSNMYGRYGAYHPEHTGRGV